MEIVIRSQGFDITPALRAYAARRLQFALPLDVERVRRVSLLLKDLNGPRGGDDKCCRIQVVMNGEEPVITEETKSDAYVAIDRASERAARKLYRLMERRSARRISSRAAREELAYG